MTLRFVIPALNEADNVPRLLARLEQAMAVMGMTGEVILVDDGSRDDTAARAQAHCGRLMVRVIRHPVTRGPGTAFRTGFTATAAIHCPGDLWCTMESDNTSDPGILGEMVRRAGRDADLVLASVYGPGGAVVGTTPFRKALSAAANALMRAVFRLTGVRTFTSFYRVYRGDLMVRALEMWGGDLVREQGFACMAELLVKLHRLGARIEEVPMVLDGQARAGASHMRVARNAAAHLRLIGRYFCSGGFRPPRTRGRPAVSASAQSTSVPRNPDSRAT
jgi:dolichol-phosphate mannosyltransferase